MKATGIVRRIDDLGRVVIPKEIRRTMRIREGDPLEIYTNNDGEVIFKKYSPINELSEGATQAAEVIYKLAGLPVVVFDRDHVVSVAGAQKKEYSQRRISPALEDILENRKSYIFGGDHTTQIMPVEGVGRHAVAASPIISSGDVIGAVAILSNENTTKGDDHLLTLSKAAAMFLGKQIEE